GWGWDWDRRTVRRGVVGGHAMALVVIPETSVTSTRRAPPFRYTPSSDDQTTAEYAGICDTTAPLGAVSDGAKGGARPRPARIGRIGPRAAVQGAILGTVDDGEHQEDDGHGHQ